MPAFTESKSHAEIEFPIDAVDGEAPGRWTDERILNFVRIYLSL